MEEVKENPNKTEVYKVVWNNAVNPGYVVYRDIFDHEKCPVEEGSLTHMEALFVCEDSAKTYCAFRNNLMWRNCLDDLCEVDRLFQVTEPSS